MACFSYKVINIFLYMYLYFFQCFLFLLVSRLITGMLKSFIKECDFLAFRWDFRNCLIVVCVSIFVLCSEPYASKLFINWYIDFTCNFKKCFLLVPITQYLVYFGRIGVERIKCYDSSVIGSHVVKSVYITSYFTDTTGVLGNSLFSCARTLL